MEPAKPRKNGAVEFTSRHLVSTAHQALAKTRQTEVAKRLGVADSTVLRRTEKFPEVMDTLAAAGVEDFVLKGERKLSIEQYRYLMTIAMEFARIQLELTGGDSGDGTSFPA